MSTQSKFIKDSYWAVGAQAVSLLTSVVVSFILPKFISIADFGYWQYFLLVASYVGVLHFGFGDGIYLQLGGQYWNCINRREWMPKMMLSFIFQFSLSLILTIVTLLLLSNDSIYCAIYLWLAIYLSIENCYKIMTMAMMSTDQMQYVSKTVIIDKVLMSLAIVTLIVLGGADVYTVVASYVLAHAVVFFIVWFKIKPYEFICDVFSKCIFMTTLAICGVGIVLMMSNIMSILLVGACRFAVEHYWDIETFSKFSFSITIASFFLVFISQIGYVLFPVLKRMKEEKQKLLFERLDFLLTLLPIMSYLFFFVMYCFVRYWLPKYMDSLLYLGFTAPFICYEIKVCMLYNTYFKNIGAIKQLLTMNALSVVCALCLYLIAIAQHNIYIMALGLLFAEFVKVWMMRWYLSNEFSVSTGRVAKFETTFNCLFVAVYYYWGIGYALMLYIATLCVIYPLFKNELLTTLKYIKSKR